MSDLQCLRHDYHPFFFCFDSISYVSILSRIMLPWKETMKTHWKHMEDAVARSRAPWLGASPCPISEPSGLARTWLVPYPSKTICPSETVFSQTEAQLHTAAELDFENHGLVTMNKSFQQEKISRSKKMTFLNKYCLSGRLYPKASISFSGDGPLPPCPTTWLTTLLAVSSLPLLLAAEGKLPVTESPTNFCLFCLKKS